MHKSIFNYFLCYHSSLVRNLIMIQEYLNKNILVLQLIIRTLLITPNKNILKILIPHLALKLVAQQDKIHQNKVQIKKYILTFRNNL